MVTLRSAYLIQRIWRVRKLKLKKMHGFALTEGERRVLAKAAFAMMGNCKSSLETELMKEIEKQREEKN